jgi:3(or 17)beta-hydroxysteroid dehydrogenase
MRRLDGKTYAVTGAACGIGRTIATRFGEEGARVIVTDVDETAGAALAEQVGGASSAWTSARRPAGCA